MKLRHRIQRDGLLAVQRKVVGGAAFFDEIPAEQCLYFSNHTSHLDTVSILSALPVHLRDKTRPVAGADYWGSGALRRHIALNLLNAVLIDRTSGGADALLPLEAALDAGDSLVIFPEGTRLAADLPAPFKSGMFHLTKNRPRLALVPVYQENMHKAFPKGAPFPLPLLCRLHFGKPIFNNVGEDKGAFLARAHKAVCDLASTF